MITPTVGMPCTIRIGSDRYSGKVTLIISAKRIKINEKIWSLRKDGIWRPAGCGFNSGYSLELGYAENYSDPSF